MNRLSITWRILAVNALIMTALVIGVIAGAQSRETVVTLELESLVQALKNPPVNDSDGGELLDPDSDALQWRRLLHDEHPFTVMFQSKDTTTARKTAAIARPDAWLEKLVGLFPLPDRFPLLVNGQIFSAMPASLVTKPHVIAWRTADQRLVVSVQGFTPDGSQWVIFKTRTWTNDVMQDTRLAMARFILLALGLNLVMAIYLAAKIGRPLNDLARAARSVPEADIPDLSDRLDEIGDLSLALRSMVDQLKNQRDDMQRFAADVAHELKNPLASLRSAATALENVTESADRKILCAIIDDDVRRMDRLITDIAHLTRLDATLAHNAGQVDTDLTQILAGYDSVATITGVQNSPPVRVAARDDHLRQVFDNLLANARSFHRGPAQVRLTLEQTPDHSWCITIDDDGPGIPAGSKDKIFERFYSERADASAGKHSGLGLSIARRIVIAAGGTITAINRLHPDGRIAGARFIVVFPTERKPQ